MAGLNIKAVKTGLMLLDIGKAVRAALESWNIDCDEKDAQELVMQGRLVKLLIRHEWRKRKGSEKGIAIQRELGMRYGVSDGLIRKIVYGRKE